MNTYEKHFVKVNDDTSFHYIQIKLRTLSIQNIESCNFMINNTDRIDSSIYYTNFQYYKIIEFSYSYSLHFDVIQYTLTPNFEVFRRLIHQIN